MSSRMPEFEMPAEVQAPSAAVMPGDRPSAAPLPVGAPPVPAAPGPAALDAADLTGEPDASDEPRPARRRLAWRQLLVAGMIGVLLGAAVPASVQGLERAAAAAEAEALRTLASDYLAAIAEGRADDATALAPVGEERGELAPAAVLAAARPIEDAEVRTVHREGDAATIAVHYRLAGVGEVSRSLDADRVDGRWRLTSTLLERVSMLYFDTPVVPEIAGFPIAADRTLLYPGRYVLDAVEGPVFRVEHDPFSIDGDPRTRAEVYSMSVLVPEVLDLATRYASLAAPVCDASRHCTGEPGAALRPAGDAYMSASTASAVDVLVPMSSGDGPNAAWVEMPLRILLDDQGSPAAWECGVPGEFTGTFEPCPALG